MRDTETSHCIRRYGLLAWLSCALLACSGPALANTQPLKVLSITPTGNNVAVPKQIVINFNQPMVPVGKAQLPKRPDAITISPEVGCDWRWLNQRSLACQLNSSTPLAYASHYSIRVTNGISALNGEQLSKPQTARFTTKRPRYRRQRFEQWLSPTKPSWQLYFDRGVTQTSVAKSFSLVDRQGRSYPLKISPPKRNYYGRGRQWFATSAAELPANRQFQLVVRPGLRGHDGPALGQQNAVIASIATFPRFDWNAIQCHSIDGSKQTRRAGQNHALLCDPDRNVELVFSSPVLEVNFNNALKLTPSVPTKNRGGKYSRLGWADNSKGYRYTLPAPLTPRQNYKLLLARVTDEFGRRLAQPLKLEFATSRRAKRLEITHPNAYVESNTPHSDVPFATVNQTSAIAKYARLTAEGFQANLEQKIELPSAKDLTLLNPMGLAKLLESDSGVAIGRLSADSDKHGEEELTQPFFAQMSPYQVSAKLGYANSLLWVSDMHSGAPIADAQVSLHITKGNDLEALTKPAIFTAKTDANGLVNFTGRSQFKELALWPAWKIDQSRLVITISHQQNLAVLPLDNRFAINLWGIAKDVWQQPAAKHGHAKAWGTTAQGIYRAGDTVDFKVWLRDVGVQGLTQAPAGDYEILITDPKGDRIHSEAGVQLTSTGSYVGRFKLNKNAQSGWYKIAIKADFGNLTAARVMVSDFTPAPFKVSNSLRQALYHSGEQVIADTEARLHAGGPYTAAQTRITARIRPTAVKTDDPLAKQFVFDTSGGQSYTEQVHSAESQLNNDGNLTTRFALAETNILYGKLLFESAVSDDRGKDIAAYASAQYAGRDRYVGIRAQHWLGTAQQTDWFEALVVDSKGATIDGHAIELTIERRETYAARVKGPGNAFLTKYKHRWVAVTECQLVSQAKAGQRCQFTPEKAGNYRATAIIRDNKNREHKSREWLWVSGSDAIVWDRGNGHGTKVEPEKSSYQLGETARFLVQNPYPGAQALITIERYGILKQWLQTLPHSTAIIEVPIEADYVPGFYLGVHIVAPRKETPGPDPQARPGTYVDLGKPTFAIGYSKMQVSQPIKRIDVDVNTDKPVYRPKQTVKVTLQAKPRIDSLPLTEPTELTVVVLDEAVFDLVPGRADHYDPYKGFYNLDSLDVQTFTTLKRLVGRIGFSRKGASPGGDGGNSPALRNLFKFVAHWQPTLMTDANGQASFEFQVPDNLTGWRILVIANDSSERFGLGQGQFKVNQPTELRAVMPNHTYADDQLLAGISVMNRTQQTRLLHLTMLAEGDIDPTQANHLVTSINLAPFQRQVVRLPVIARWTDNPNESPTRKRQITFTATAEPADAAAATDSDALRFSLPVRQKLISETVASYGSLAADGTTAEANISLAIPKDIVAKRSSAGFQLSASLVGPLDSNFAYMRDYPYLCWEQRSSKALMAQRYLQLKPYFSEALQWPDAKKLIQDTIEQAANFQAPSGGMAYFQADDARVSPYLSAHTAWVLQRLAKAGYPTPPAVQNKLMDYLKGLLREDRFPSYYGLSGRSNNRAIILAVLAKTGSTQDSDFDRVSIDELSTFGLAWMLQAQLAHQPRSDDQAAWATRRQQLINALLARSNQTSGGLSFADDSQPWLLGSSQRNQCAVLSAIVADQASNQPSPQLKGRAEQLARHLLQSPERQKHGWSGTQETLYCASAMSDFAADYENTEVTAELRAALGQRAIGAARFGSRLDQAQQLMQPLRNTDVGSNTSLTLTKSGKGRIYYAATLNYTRAKLPDQPQQAGMSLQREFSIFENGQWRLLKNNETVKTGQQIRVDLYLQTPGQHYYVVVSDPLPAALEAVNSRLSTSSASAASGAYGPIASDSLASSWSEQQLRPSGNGFYHQELRHHAAQFYADELAAGRYRLSYIAQVIAAGQFSVVPAHAEAMYQPEVFGNSAAYSLQVTPSQ